MTNILIQYQVLELQLIVTVVITLPKRLAFGGSRLCIVGGTLHPSWLALQMVLDLWSHTSIRLQKKNVLQG